MKKANKPNHKNSLELSRPLRIDSLPRAGIEDHIVAKPAERAALAKRLKLDELKRFEGTIVVEPKKSEMFSVTGEIYAEVTQKCVVTLAPVKDVVRERLDMLMVPDYILNKQGASSVNEYSEEEDLEPIVGGVIDLGEIAVQLLAVAINPYPRIEGKVWEAVTIGESSSKDEPKINSPFLKLVKGKKVS